MSIPAIRLRRYDARAGRAGLLDRTGDRMRYLLLIASEPPATPPSDADWAAMLEQYNEFGAWAGEKGWVLGGEALEDVSTATTVSIRDGQRIVTDGPFAETKEHLGGYYLIDVPSLDDAIETAFRIPGASIGRIEIRPIKEFG
jgi:hypothetical protein